MKSVGRVASNLWLALSSSRNNLASSVLTSALTSNHNPKSMLTTMSMSASNVDEAATVSQTLTSSDAISRLSQYHPVVVEGMGYYDPRDPQTVASSIIASLQEHLHQQYTPTNDSTHKPLLVIIQGDPLAPRGISAITPLVANALSDQQRGLVCLDNHIADYHSKNADRNNVILEVKYSQLVQVLQEAHGKPLLDRLECAVDAHISQQNKERAVANKPPVKDYFKTFAMLQEVTKASLQQICGNVTIAHTSEDINPWSVTSFYKVGLDLGLYPETDIVGYNTSTHFRVPEESLDFETIDLR